MGHHKTSFESLLAFTDHSETILSVIVKRLVITVADWNNHSFWDLIAVFLASFFVCVLCMTQKAVSFAYGRLYSRCTAQHTSMAAKCSSNWTIEHLSADWFGANKWLWGIKHQWIVLWEGDFSTVFQYEWYGLKKWGLFFTFLWHGATSNFPMQQKLHAHFDTPRSDLN